MDWGDWEFGSVASALAFQSLTPSSIPGRKPVFLLPSYLRSACVSRPSISTSIGDSLILAKMYIYTSYHDKIILHFNLTGLLCLFEYVFASVTIIKRVIVLLNTLH